MAEARRGSRPQEGRMPQQNGVRGRPRAEQGDVAEDEGSQPGGSGVQQEDDDPAARRHIRHQYRELINNVQQNREDMLSPNNNKLTEALEEANKLFVNVRQAREAALDAQFLVLATDLGKEKASQLHAEGTVFDPVAFAEHLLSFMGLNRLEEGEESDEEGFGGGYLPRDAWHRLGREAEKCFKTSPSFHYMLGSFLPDPPAPRQRVERQRRAPSKEERRIMPTQLKKMEESYQEATEKEVERILAILQSYYDEDPSSPISYFEFVIDPKSFSRTVENIFHVSFLVRDGLAKIELDNYKLPVIAPVLGEQEAGGSGSGRKQCIVAISPQTWKVSRAP
ncbi:NSE4A protein, partial [Amia calva]|nr:NSE4A protein [Amia calva]